MTIPPLAEYARGTGSGAEASDSTEGSHRHQSAPGPHDVARDPLPLRTGHSACRHPGGRPSCQPLRVGRESVGSASCPASLALTWRGRRVGGLGPGLTSESADAVRVCPANRFVGRVPGFCGTHRRCRSDLPGLDQRPGFHRSDGQRVRAIPQPEKGMTVTIASDSR
jgi:hypothetical protein